MQMKKFIGEPYAGKPHVRFDEGAGKGLSPSRSTLLSSPDFLCVTKKVKNLHREKARG